MAQNPLSVVNPNPTPPTNFSAVFLGQTPPNPPAQPTVDDGVATTTTAFAAKATSVDNTNFPSVESEGRGTEVVATQSYSAGIYNPAGPLVTVSCEGAYTTTPNRDHASSLTPATNPAIGALTPASTASGSGTFSLAVAGTNYTPQSIVYVNGVKQATTFNSATSLTAPTVPKKATAGTQQVTVVTGGGVTTSPATLTFT